MDDHLLRRNSTLLLRECKTAVIVQGFNEMHSSNKVRQSPNSFLTTLFLGLFQVCTSKQQMLTLKAQEVSNENIHALHSSTARKHAATTLIQTAWEP